MTLHSKLIAKIFLMAFAAFASVAAVSCEDSKSYADQLAEENKSVNRFLADQRVYETFPADSTSFEIGPDAPYYCLDEENSIYMQVLDRGNGEKAREGQTVYFRSRRYALTLYYGTLLPENWSGNSDNMAEEPTYFKFDDYTDYASQSWGTGLQQPLKFLNLNCEVNLVVKSQYGVSSELANVTPYLYRVRYFKSQI